MNGRAARAAAEALAISYDSNGIAEKAAAAAQRIELFRQELKRHRDFSQQAQIREALMRTGMTVVVKEALAGRAEAESRLRAMALALHLSTQGRSPLRARRRPTRELDRLLSKLGPVGEALMILRAGVWPGANFGDRFSSALQYAAKGRDPGQHPRALFDQAGYLAAYPEAAASGRSALTYYLLAGATNGHAPHPLFDPGYYAASVADVLGAHSISPLEHFARTGAADGQATHPLFDLAHYLAQDPQLAPGERPVDHYLRTGWRDGLSPHPLFDPAWYQDQNPGSGDAPPLLHYLSVGWRRGLSPHPLFDPVWYLETNPDLGPDAEPLTHFLVSGAQEGRNPGPWFDVALYRARRGADLTPAVNPLVDYLRGGAWSGADALPDITATAYVAGEPGAARGGMTPLEHWARKARGV